MLRCAEHKLHDASHVVAFAISLSRFVEFIEPADTNRFVTARKSISHDRRVSIYLSFFLSFLLPFGSLPRSSRNSSFSLHFLQLGTEGEREGKKKLLISKDIKYPPPRWISRDLQQRAPSRILFCLRSFRSKTRRLSKQNNVSMGQERESLP